MLQTDKRTDGLVDWRTEGAVDSSFSLRLRLRLLLLLSLSLLLLLWLPSPSTVAMYAAGRRCIPFGMFLIFP